MNIAARCGGDIQARDQCFDARDQLRRFSANDEAVGARFHAERKFRGRARISGVGIGLRHQASQQVRDIDRARILQFDQL